MGTRALRDGTVLLMAPDALPAAGIAVGSTVDLLSSPRAGTEPTTVPSRPSRSHCTRARTATRLGGEKTNAVPPNK